MEQCRQGKSAKWIRNLGKRIGSRVGTGSSPNPASHCQPDARATLAASGLPHAWRGGQLGTGPSGSLPRASNSRL
ncbi:hypothetical protein K1719_044285 [Acacia pycnantha]|nr:hypothetical protein K1719_044285 [Acacia pycnantha]